MTKDSGEKLDKWVSWALTTLAAAALVWLSAEIRDMRDKISALSSKAAVVDAAKYDDRIAKLDDRVRAVELKVK